MRHQGRITKWKDDRGFGFITPDRGDTEIFVHISSFANRRRRPSDNDVVTFELGADNQGRMQAQRIAFADDRVSWSGLSKRSYAPCVFVTAFFAVLTGATFVGRLQPWVVIIYVIASGIAFVAYAIDKSAALHGRWRTQETTLHILALIGGWPGALLAQTMLRHKSKKLSFKIVYWITVLINVSALACLAIPSVAPLLQRVVSSLSSMK